MKVIQTDEEFANLLTKYDRVLVDFYAEWCGPCKKVAPFVEDLGKVIQKANPKHIVVKVDVDNDEMTGTIRENSITAMPTFLFLSKGEKPVKVLGANIPQIIQTSEKFFRIKLE